MIIHIAVLTAMPTVASAARRKKSKLTDAQMPAMPMALLPNPAIWQMRMILFLRRLCRRHWTARLLIIAGLTALWSWLADAARDLQWLNGSFALAEWVTLNDAVFERLFKLIKERCASAAAFDASAANVAEAVDIHAANHDAALAMYGRSICGAHLGTVNILAVHRANAHGHTRLACHYDGTNAYCWVCLEQYGSRAKIIGQLCMLSFCISNQVIFSPPISLADAVKIVASDREASKGARSQVERSSFLGIPRRSYDANASRFALFSTLSLAQADLFVHKNWW
jgi:hypothetical protein